MTFSRMRQIHASYLFICVLYFRLYDVCVCPLHNGVYISVCICVLNHLCIHVSVAISMYVYLCLSVCFLMLILLSERVYLCLCECVREYISLMFNL